MDITTEQLAGIINHMNEDHEASLVLYAHAFANRKEVTSASMTNLTKNQIILEIENGEALSVPLSSPVLTAEDAHKVLVKMHREAMALLDTNA